MVRQARKEYKVQRFLKEKNQIGFCGRFKLVRIRYPKKRKKETLPCKMRNLTVVTLSKKMKKKKKRKMRRGFQDVGVEFVSCVCCRSTDQPNINYILFFYINPIEEEDEEEDQLTKVSIFFFY